MAAPVVPDLRQDGFHGDPHKLTFAERRALFAGLNRPRKSSSKPEGSPLPPSFGDVGDLGSPYFSDSSPQQGCEAEFDTGPCLLWPRDASASEQLSKELSADTPTQYGNNGRGLYSSGADAPVAPNGRQNWAPIQAVSSAANVNAASPARKGLLNVVVTECPFGMNIQVKGVPRVVEVFPGSPADATGVLKGFLLLSVNGVEVTADDWIGVYGAAQPPFSVVFDTAQSPDLMARGFADLELPVEGDPFGENFEEFRCKVVKLPLGLQVCQRPRTWARVEAVMIDFPAHQAGVCEGDLLVEIGGQSVRSDTWFLVMQQNYNSLPFELCFRRPLVRAKDQLDTRATLQDTKTPELLAIINDAVKASPVFQHIAEEHMDKVIRAFRGPVRIPAGAEVFRQACSVDAHEPALYMLEQGHVEAFAVKPGQEHPGSNIANFQKNGQTFGYVALLYDCPRAATVIAKADSVLWHISRDDFKHYIDNKEVAGIVAKHTQTVAKAGFSCSSIAAGFSIFDVNLTDGPEMQANLLSYYNFCKNSSELSCTVDCFSTWNQNKKTNGYAKLIPAVHSSTPDFVRIFFFDDNIEWVGKATSPGIVNLRDVVSGEFVEFGEGVNGFKREHVGTNTIIYHSSEYQNVLVQANILDAMEDENYFTDIIKRYLQPDEKAIIFMDVNSTIISVDSVSCKDMSQLVLGTMSEFVNLQLRDAFELTWDDRPSVKVGKSMHLKKLAKEICKDDKAMYKQFYTYENCSKLISLAIASADLKWALQDEEFSEEVFRRQYDRYLVSLAGGTNEDGTVRSWFKCQDYCAGRGDCIMLTTYGVDGRKVIVKTVEDERQVLQFASCFSKWDARDVESFEKIYGSMANI